MHVPLNHFIRPGLVLHVAYQKEAEGEGVLRCLEKTAQDTYFEAVEVTSMPDASVRRRARAILECAGLQAAFGAQGLLLGAGLSLADTSASRRQKAVDAVRRGIEEAAELGAIHCQFLSGTYDPKDEEGAFEALLASTDALCAYAETLSVPVLCEIFDYDVDKRALIGPSTRAVQYAERVQRAHKAFGLQADLSHIPLQHENIEECIRTVRPFLSHVHIGNAVMEKGQAAYGDMHPRFGFPHGANGISEIARFLRSLLDTGYLTEGERRIVSFEGRPWEQESPSLVIANAKRALDAAWQLV